MKMLVIWICLATMKLAANEVPLATLRQLYYQAAAQKTASASLSNLLKEVNERSAPILYCYKGAAYMMQAKYAFNPITKLSRFNKGKTAIESAIKRDPEQLEMRFIRFSIQNNLPSFLGYDDNIESDKQKMLNGVRMLKDLELKKNITEYLIASKKCTKEELNRLKNDR